MTGKERVFEGDLWKGEGYVLSGCCSSYFLLGVSLRLSLLLDNVKKQRWYIPG